MKSGGRLSRHVAVTWKGFIVMFSCMLVLAALMGSFPSISSVHHVTFWDHLINSLDMELNQLHIHDHYLSRQINEVKALKKADMDMSSGFMRELNNQSITQVKEEDNDGANDDDNGGLTGDLDVDNKYACTKNRALLKVFMYDLPPEFHFGMIEPIDSKDGIWPRNFTQIVRYPGGLYQQHSPEYWLTLDLIKSEEVLDDDDGVLRSRPCVAIRVKEEREADVFFVPFFSSLSYNKYSRMGVSSRNVQLQRSLVNYLVKQEPWKRSRGRDHIIMMHHPNSLNVAREHLGDAMFIVADFGRYSSSVANFGKDVVAPYKHIIPSFQEDFSTFDTRPTLLFFQGAIVRKAGGIIRQKLYNLIKNEKGVEFNDGSPGSQGIRSATKGMRSSKFCLHLAGDTPSSNRLFDAIASHCVPVIISKDIELPYEEVLDYSEFCLFVHSYDALKKGFLIGLLRSIGREEWTSMWKRLKEVHIHFEYQFPSQEDDAVQMIWKSVSHKLPTINQAMHKVGRYSTSSLFKSF